MPKQGVYWSANDRVYDWAFAFLESFREFNPNVALSLIPFNSECDRLFDLIKNYNCDIYIDSSFAELESFGSELELGLTPVGKYWFRRFASFWGGYEQFVYLDCRTLVLGDLQPLLNCIGGDGFDLLHYDCAIDQVYEQSDFRRKMLSETGSRGFNSGRWAARKGLFSLEELKAYASECRVNRQFMNPRNTDQFFLNYCCDMKGVRTAHLADVLGDTCQDGWARQAGDVYPAVDGYRRWDFGGLSHRKRVLLLHWAGIKLSAVMPEANLFFTFRDREFCFLRRAFRRVRRAVIWPLLSVAQRVRANRHLNTLWHHWSRQ